MPQKEISVYILLQLCEEYFNTTAHEQTVLNRNVGHARRDQEVIAHCISQATSFIAAWST